MSDLFFHMANNNNNNDDDDQILVRHKGMYYWVAYLINKVLKVPFETTSFSSLIFKLFFH